MKRTRPPPVSASASASLSAAAAAYSALLASSLLVNASVSAATFSHCCCFAPSQRRSLHHRPSARSANRDGSNCRSSLPIPIPTHAKWRRRRNCLPTSLSGWTDRVDDDCVTSTTEQRRRSTVRRRNGSGHPTSIPFRDWFGSTAAALALLAAVAAFSVPLALPAFASSDASSQPVVVVVANAAAATSPVSVASPSPLPSTSTFSSPTPPETPAASPPTAPQKKKKKLRYYTIMNTGTRPEIKAANEALLDHAVGTINAIYYDSTGGVNFTPRDLYDRWRALRAYANGGAEGLARLRVGDAERGVDRLKWMRSGGNGVAGSSAPMPEDAFGSRTNAIEGIRWLVGTLNDPYSKYLTREELWDELDGTKRRDGFLGMGAIVEPPPSPPQQQRNKNSAAAGAVSRTATNVLLSSTRVENMPIVSAVTPDSPAERAGITVGDRIAAVGDDKFVGSRREVTRKLTSRYTRGENYVGYPDLTIVKPVVRAAVVDDDDEYGSDSDSSWRGGERVVGYRRTRVRLPTALVEPFRPYVPPPSIQSVSSSLTVANTDTPIVSGGDAVVHYELLTPTDSIFRMSIDSSVTPSDAEGPPVGYIRLTRFSRSATLGYLNAVSELEAAGAQSYIIDVRNNYGGIIQEAMLTASTLLRDPKAVLCYTMNSRGGLTPQSVEDFIRDKRYPGYLLSREPSSATLDQVRRVGGPGGDDPGGERQDGIMWVPSTSYSSLHEQAVKKGIRRANSASTYPSTSSSASLLGYVGSFPNNFGVSNIREARRQMQQEEQRRAQKPIAILVNEGTASSAEMFASALRDNGRTIALIGTKTYGKGLIQHTFPMPDGGALRLTIAEYLTPALKHVTNVGGARFDQETGDLVGGGIRPDVYCPSKDGIPSNVGADFCVGMALDALENADVLEEEMDVSQVPSVTIALKIEGGGTFSGFNMADSTSGRKRSSGRSGILKYRF